jgi:hypothetical protein
MSKTLSCLPRKFDLVVFDTSYTSRLADEATAAQLRQDVRMAFVVDSLWGTGTYVTDPSAWPADRVKRTLNQLPRRRRDKKLMDGIVAFRALGSGGPGGSGKLELSRVFRLFAELQGLEYCSLFNIMDMQARVLKDGTTVLIVAADAESG